MTKKQSDHAADQLGLLIKRFAVMLEGLVDDRETLKSIDRRLQIIEAQMTTESIPECVAKTAVAIEELGKINAQNRHIMRMLRLLFKLSRDEPMPEFSSFPNKAFGYSNDSRVRNNP